MAITVDREQLREWEPRLPLYGARAGAFAAYVAAVATGVAMLAPVLRGTDGATARPLPPEAQLVEARSGETLAGVAARSGVSLARLLALNPELAPFGLERGQPVRVR